MKNMNSNDRRHFLQMMGMGAVVSTLNASIAKALSIPVDDRRGTILNQSVALPTAPFENPSVAGLPDASASLEGVYDGTIRVVSGKLTHGGGKPMMARRNEC